DPGSPRASHPRIEVLVEEAIEGLDTVEPLGDLFSLPLQLVADRGDTFGDKLNYALEVLDLDIDTANLGFQLVEPLRGLLSKLRSFVPKRANLLIHSVEPLRGLLSKLRCLLPKRANLLIRSLNTLSQLIEPLCVLCPKGL